MDILLIYPPLSVDKRYGNKRLGNIGGNLPPLGIAYIASVLRDKGFSVGIIDGPATGVEDDAIVNQIKKENPKIVGLSAITPVFHRAVHLAERIRSASAHILIVIGGHHASILPTEVLQEYPCFDIAVYGEGEITAVELLTRFKEYGFNRDNFLKDSGSLRRIAGIVFRQENQIVMNPPRDLVQDLDSLPFPAWDLLPMDKYIPLPNQYLHAPVIHLVAVRGCAFQCSFCSNNAVFGRKIRALSPMRLVDIIRYAKNTFKAREISFWDDSLTTDRQWLMSCCEAMIKNRLDITWTCYARVNTVDRELLKIMKRAGCWNIFYGFESGTQELLDMIDKKITLEQIKKANQWTKEAGIEVRASFMLALPGETPQLAEKTIDFAISLNPDYAQFSITTPFPKTKLYAQAQEYGRLTENFSRYNLWEPIFVPFGYKDHKQIEKMGKRAVRRFYFRPAYIYGRIKKIRSLEDIIRYVKGLRMMLGFLMA